MNNCVICRGSGKINLAVHRPLSHEPDVSYRPIDDSRRTYSCPECVGKQVADEKVTILHGETTLFPMRALHPNEEDAVHRGLAKALADEMLRGNLISFRREEQGERVVFTGKVGIVSPRLVMKTEQRALQMMSAFLGGVLNKARDRISVWGSHYSGGEGFIRKDQAVGYVSEAFREHLQETERVFNEGR